MNQINKVNYLINTYQKLFLRNYAFKSDLKIKWVRPEKISCVRPEKSGDLSSFPNLNTDEYCPNFKDSKQLLDADPIVQDLFKLKNNIRKRSTELVITDMVDMVKRHDLDTGSMESKLAKMTANIRSLQKCFDEFPRNKRVKVELKELIDKRKKYLKYLRRWDYKRFEWILEKLDIIYKAPPSEFHWITRKESLRKLTNTHCENIKNERLNIYRNYLESQQLGFLEKKLSNLEFIRKEQIECNLPITVKEENITIIKKQLSELREKRNE